MAEQIKSTTIDINRPDGSTEVKFSEHFLTTFERSIDAYDQSLNYLEGLIKGQNFTNDYGVCNCKYEMAYITPHDIASYISYVLKAVSKHLIECNIPDMEKLAVELAKRFVLDNSGFDFSRTDLFANSTYADPRTQTLMDLLVQMQNTFFDRCVYSKFEMEQRAKDLKSDYDTMNGMHFGPAMKAVVKALPDTIKNAMKDSLTDGIQCCNCDLIMIYIEMFILFVCSLNTCTVEQMIGYVQPRSTFIRKEASKFKTESYNETAFNGFITECSIIKTNDINIRSRIPFDCNMRNIVLQDVTPDFKDSKSALHFMLKDNRSPIHALLIKYATEKQIAPVADCIPAMTLFEPYFRPPMSPIQGELDRVGFLTDVNWLDKIAYGNQFMDGNYRLDALGDENKHPIVLTLQTLHKMYCGCNLKTSEDLANQILKIAGLMHAVIESNWNIMNRQLTTDILCVLGDCFTRCVLKLYNNNCVVIVASDDMKDTMVPGYTYCEQFVYEAEAKPGVTVTASDGSGTAPNQTGLSKLKSIIRQFAQWIAKKFSQFARLFLVTNDAKIKYITSHQEQNQKIGEALGKTMNANMANLPRYKVPYKAMTDKINNTKQQLDLVNQYLKDGQISDEEMLKLKMALYPGDDTIARRIATTEDVKQRQEMIRQYILFSKLDPTAQDTAMNGNMTKEVWDDIVDTLTNSGKLIEGLTKGFTSVLNDEMKLLNQKLQEEERAATQPQQQNQNGQQQQQKPTGVAQKLYDVFKLILDDYQMNSMNTLGKTMFNTYYDVYKKVYDAYQSQAKAQPQQQTPQPQNTQPQGGNAQ